MDTLRWRSLEVAQMMERGAPDRADLPLFPLGNEASEASACAS